MRNMLYRLWHRLLHLYRRSSIQGVISISFTAVAVTGMVFLGAALLMRFSLTTEVLVTEGTQRVIDQVNLNLDTYLRNMMRVSDSAYYRVIKNTDLATEGLDDKLSLLHANYHDVLAGISVFAQDGSLVYSVPLNLLKPNVRPQEQEWFRIAVQRIENLHFSTPHVQNLFADPANRYRWVVSLSRQVELTRDGSIESGVLLVDMNFSGIEQIFKDVTLGESGYLYLADGRGELIYHPRQQLVYANLLQENNRNTVLLEDGSHREEFAGQSRMITVKTVGYTGWKIIGVTPLDSVASNLNQIRLYALFIIVFSIFMLVSVNLFVSSRIAVPIKALDQSVRELEAGLAQVQIASGGCYEVEHLGNSIRSMVSTMHQLMDDIVQQERSKRKSELDVLQAQINPHFLYNTLDSIVWMIESERYPEAISMVTSLARLFRISLSRGRSAITVGEELEHAAHYLSIQKVRYGNRFSVEMDIEEEAKELTTIKLVVQPILENAIYHGMEYMDEDEGRLRVHAYCEQDSLLIDIEDNGLGMPPALAQSLLEPGTVPPSGKKGSGIGLRNVHQRIRLTFGEPYGLTVLSRPDEGTLVRIRMPKTSYSEAIQKEGAPHE